MHCPSCSGSRLTTIQVSQVNGELVKDMGCILCLHRWTVNLGPSVVIFVDFRNKVVLDRKAG